MIEEPYDEEEEGGKDDDDLDMDKTLEAEEDAEENTSVDDIEEFIIDCLHYGKNLVQLGFKV